MRISNMQWLWIPTLFFVGACGSEAGEPNSSVAVDEQISFAAASTPPQIVSAASEAAAVQQFLDDRYGKKDVWYSFETAFGETIDCVDYNAQWAVKLAKASGKPVDDQPTVTSSSSSSSHGALWDYQFHGQPDSYGRARACPDGSVPMLRITADDIKASGGLAEFRRRVTQRLPSKQGVAAPSFLSAAETSPPSPFAYDHVQGNYTGGGPVVSAWTVASLPVKRQIDSHGSHSISQVWVKIPGLYGQAFKSQNPGGTACTRGLNCYQTIEVGWNIDPGLYPTNNPTNPHLFIYATNDGYDTGCYNNIQPNCVPFNQAVGATMTPGMTLPASVAGTSKREITIKVNNLSGAAWQIFTAEDTENSSVFIGYYPSAGFFGTMLTNATAYSFGGEALDLDGSVGSNTLSTPMGNGSSPYTGYGQAAYQRSYAACSGALGSGICAGPQTFSYGVDDPTHPYTYSTSTPAGGSGWDQYFYFGEESRVFWGQNWGFQFSPIPDWAVGSYKGECGSSGTDFHPVTGVSSYTPGQGHAIECLPASISALPGTCYGRQIGTSDNRGTTDNIFPGGDWDNGFIKGECKANEFVQGVAQDANTGAISAILCCQGQVTHGNCFPEVFYGQNSPAFNADMSAGTTADWDSGFYKGSCEAGEYAAGISKVASSRNGIVGAPHALLCCNP